MKHQKRDKREYFSKTDYKIKKEKGLNIAEEKAAKLRRVCHMMNIQIPRDFHHKRDIVCPTRAELKRMTHIARLEVKWLENTIHNNTQRNKEIESERWETDTEMTEQSRSPSPVDSMYENQPFFNQHVLPQVPVHRGILPQTSYAPNIPSFQGCASSHSHDPQHIPEDHTSFKAPFSVNNQDPAPGNFLPSRGSVIRKITSVGLEVQTYSPVISNKQVCVAETQTDHIVQPMSCSVETQVQEDMLESAKADHVVSPVMCSTETQVSEGMLPNIDVCHSELDAAFANILMDTRSEVRSTLVSTKMNSVQEIASISNVPLKITKTVDDAWVDNTHAYSRPEVRGPVTAVKDLKLSSALESAGIPQYAPVTNDTWDNTQHDYSAGEQSTATPTLYTFAPVANPGSVAAEQQGVYTGSVGPAAVQIGAENGPMMYSIQVPSHSSWGSEAVGCTVGPMDSSYADPAAIEESGEIETDDPMEEGEKIPVIDLDMDGEGDIVNEEEDNFIHEVENFIKGTEKSKSETSSSSEHSEKGGGEDIIKKIKEPKLEKVLKHIRAVKVKKHLLSLIKGTKQQKSSRNKRFFLDPESRRSDLTVCSKPSLFCEANLGFFMDQSRREGVINALQNDILYPNMVVAAKPLKDLSDADLNTYTEVVLFPHALISYIQMRGTLTFEEAEKIFLHTNARDEDELDEETNSGLKKLYQSFETSQLPIEQEVCSICDDQHHAGTPTRHQALKHLHKKEFPYKGRLLTLHTQDGKARVSQDFVKIVHQQLMLYKNPLAQLSIKDLEYQILSVGVDEASIIVRNADINMLTLIAKTACFLKEPVTLVKQITTNEASVTIWPKEGLLGKARYYIGNDEGVFISLRPGEDKSQEQMRRDKTPDKTTTHDSSKKRKKKRRSSSSSSSSSNSSGSSNSSSSSEDEEPSVKNKEAKEDDEIVMKIDTNEVKTLYGQGKKSCIIGSACKAKNSSHADHLQKKETARNHDNGTSDCRMNDKVTQKQVKNVEEKKRRDKEEGIPKARPIRKIEWNGGKSSKDSKGSDDNDHSRNKKASR